MKRLLAICLFCAASGAAFGANSEASRASEDLGAASAVVVGGSLSMLAASGQIDTVTVESVSRFVRRRDPDSREIVLSLD